MKLRINCLIVLIFLKISLFSQESSTIIRLKEDKYLKIQACTEKIFRIRVSANGQFPESLMERYGIINTDWNKLPVVMKEDNGIFTFSSGIYQIITDLKTGSLSIGLTGKENIIQRIQLYPTGKDEICISLRESLKKKFGKDRFGGGIIGDTAYTGVQRERLELSDNQNVAIYEFSIGKDERFYGAGSANRESIQHRGKALRIWATYQRSESPMPFLMSSKGWGIFNNGTARSYFDVGRFDADKLFVYNVSPEIDFYVMLGNDMPKVMELYTEITGKPYLMPKFAYGMAFGSNVMENQFNVLDNAVRFRQEKIPCDIYWLEYQWMSKHYDNSTQRAWNESRFQSTYYWCPDPKDPYAYSFYVNAMKDLGFKTALWINNDNDLSIEEEDRIAKRSGTPLSGLEHWFPHLRTFIDQGVVGFKIDPNTTQDEHPDRKYYNGKIDAEMHNLNQVLVQKQMYQVFKEHTGRRSFHHYCGGFAGTQHWGGATVGDNGGNAATILDILNHSFSTNSNMSIDVLSNTPNRVPAIHYSFLIPWVNLNSWCWILHPWYYNPHDKDLFRFYAQLRYSLMPYIYSAAIQSSLTGYPMVRPMPLAFPGDTTTDILTKQYMFGEHLLVAAFTDTVYLPEGNWIDYWTENTYKGKQTIIYKIPTDKGGPLFVRAGAIIPYQKPMQYIGEHPVDTLIVKVFPNGKSNYTLFEDDGITFDYEKGAIAKTHFECNFVPGETQISIICEGSFEGMPLNRIYEMEIQSGTKPKRIMLGASILKNWKYSDGKVRLSVESKTEKSPISIILKN